jgi:hypothetical protein
LTTVFAPGAPITGAGLDGQTSTKHGTSQASPHVAGIAVLAQQLSQRELGRRLSMAEISNLLRTTGVVIHDGDDEDDNVTPTNLDFPRVDVFALAEAILGMAGAGPGTHQVVVTAGQVSTGNNFGNQGLDFGDAPATYPTLLPDGARHVIGGPSLGNAPDAEFDGHPSADALGDDTSGESDDEDGVGSLGKEHSPNSPAVSENCVEATSARR